MPYIGQKDTKTIDIGMNDILDWMGNGGHALTSFGGMVMAAEAIIKRSLLGGKGNWAASAIILATGVATTIAQLYFKDKIDDLARVYIDFELEYQEVTYTQQGATVKINQWVTVDYDVYVK